MSALIACPEGCGALIAPDRLACRPCTSKLPDWDRARVVNEHRRVERERAHRGAPIITGRETRTDTPAHPGE